MLGVFFPGPTSTGITDYSEVLMCVVAADQLKLTNLWPCCEMDMLNVSALWKCTFFMQMMERLL